MTTGNPGRRLLAGVALLAMVGPLTACIQIPDDGPVQTARAGADPIPPAQQRVSPRGPQPGAAPEEIVDGFIEAMLARPMSATVARRYLTGPASDAWHPEQGFVTYEDKSSPTGGERLRVTLTGVNRFDGRGSWLGAPPSGTSSLVFGLASERGEWRLEEAEDALVVSADWFEDTTSPMSLYFFDPEATTLVPEPVFVADGEQMPTMLVQGLLDGPVDPGVERSLVPEGLTLGLSVTVDDEGLATIPLEGGIGALPGDTVDLMAAQLAWTLRQVPSVTSLRITLDGVPLPLSSGDVEFPVSLGSAYDPTGTLATDELYGLLDGHAVKVVGGEVDTLAGPFGSRRLGLRDLSVDLGASQVAGVTRDGRVLLSTVGIGQEVTTVLTGRELLRPAWDFSDRLWMVDRGAGAAVVWVRAGRAGDAAPRVVEVPGVSGRDVVDFLVSRDGTRLVAVVRTPAGDRIVVARIRGDGAAATQAVGTRVVVRAEGTERLRITDLGWRSATGIYYLNALAGGQSELRTAILDGSPTEFDPGSFPGVLANQNVRVVSSPRPEEAVYLQRAGGDLAPVTPDSPALTSSGEVTALAYVG